MIGYLNPIPLQIGSARTVALVDERRGDMMAERRCEDDGFGNSMELCNRHDCGLQVVRPGKFQCVLEECYRLRPEPTSSCQPKSSRYPIDPPQDDLTNEATE